MIIGITEIVEKFLDYFEEENIEHKTVVSTESCMRNTAYFDDYPLQYLTIRFPEVKITNEIDQSTTIRNLFVRLVFDLQDRVKPFIFGMTTSLTASQIKTDYMHSHLTGLENGIPTFKQFCLGTGPIRTTLNSLNESGNEDYLWELFCVELDRMVHVESLAGRPYRYIRNISSHSFKTYFNFKETEPREPFMYINKERNVWDTYSGMMAYKDVLEMYAKELFENNFNIVKYENTLILGYSYPEIIQLFTDALYKWLNKDDEIYTKEDKVLIKDMFINASILVPGILMNNYFKYYDATTNLDTHYEGTFLINFKGKAYCYEIIREALSDDTYYYYLHPNIVKVFYYKIIELLNISHARTEF